MVHFRAFFFIYFDHSLYTCMTYLMVYRGRGGGGNLIFCAAGNFLLIGLYLIIFLSREIELRNLSSIFHWFFARYIPYHLSFIFSFSLCSHIQHEVVASYPVGTLKLGRGVIYYITGVYIRGTFFSKYTGSKGMEKGGLGGGTQPRSENFFENRTILYLL